MADYKLATNGVIKTANGAFVPQDVKNRDWNEYLAWAAGGGTADPLYSLAEKRINRKEDVDRKEESIIEGGVSFGGNTYNARNSDLAFLLGAEKTTKTVKWQRSNGVEVTLTAQNVTDLLALISDFIHECNHKKITLKTAIDGSLDPDALDIDTGWPTTPYTGT